jgi:hypothetical protein
MLANTPNKFSSNINNPENNNNNLVFYEQQHLISIKAEVHNIINWLAYNSLQQNNILDETSIIYLNKFKLLYAELGSINDISSVDILSWLLPFLHLVGENLNHQINLLALQALHKFIIYGLFNATAMNLPQAVNKIIVSCIELNNANNLNNNTPTHMNNSNNPVINHNSSISAASNAVEIELELISIRMLEIFIELLKNPILIAHISDDNLIEIITESFALRSKAKLSAITRYHAENISFQMIMLLFCRIDSKRMSCLHRIFRFLIAFINPTDSRNSELDIIFGLQLLLVLVQSSYTALSSYSVFINSIADDLCKHLLTLSQTKNNLILSLILRLVVDLLSSCNSSTALKLQLEIFLTSIHLRIIDSISSNSSQKQLVALSLYELSSEQSVMINLYKHFDLVAGQSRLFNDLIHCLTNHSTAKTDQLQFNSVNLLALQSLVAVLSTIHNKFCSKSTKSVTNKKEAVDLESISNEELANMNKNWSNPSKVSLALQKFNTEGSKALKYIQSILCLLPMNLTPLTTAKFLHLDGLDRNKISEYLINNNLLNSHFYQALLKEFIQLVDFNQFKATQNKEISLDEALRGLFSILRFPSNSADPSLNLNSLLIKTLEIFAEKFFRSYCANSVNFINSRAVFILSYSVLLLSVHPMSLNDFDRALRGTNAGKDFPAAFLHILYDNVNNKPINIILVTLINTPNNTPKMNGGGGSSNVMLSESCWAELLQSSRSRVELEENVGRDMFTLLSSACVNTFISYLHQIDKNCNTVATIFTELQQGFRYYSAICACYSLAEPFNNLITALARCFSALCTDRIAVNKQGSAFQTAIQLFSEDERCKFMLNVLFQLLQDYCVKLTLTDAWSSVMDCILYLFCFDLLPSSLAEHKDFLPTNVPLTAIKSLKPDQGKAASKLLQHSNSDNINPAADNTGKTKLLINTDNTNSSGLRGYLSWGMNSILSTVHYDNKKNNSYIASAPSSTQLHLYDELALFIKTLHIESIFSQSSKYSNNSLVYLVRSLQTISSYSILNSSNSPLATKENSRFALDELFSVIFYNSARDLQLKLSVNLINHVENLILNQPQEANYYIERLIINSCLYATRNVIDSAQSNNISVVSYHVLNSLRLLVSLLGLSQQILQFYSHRISYCLLVFSELYGGNIKSKEDWDNLFRCCNALQNYSYDNIFSILLLFINIPILNANNFPGLCQSLYICTASLSNQLNEEKNNKAMQLQTMLKLHDSIPVIEGREQRQECYLISLKHLILLTLDQRAEIRRIALEEVKSLLLNNPQQNEMNSPYLTERIVQEVLLPSCPSIIQFAREKNYDIRIEFIVLIFKLFIIHCDSLASLRSFPHLWIQMINSVQKALSSVKNAQELNELSQHFAEDVRNAMLIMYNQAIFNKISNHTHIDLIQLTWDCVNNFDNSMQQYIIAAIQTSGIEELFHTNHIPANHTNVGNNINNSNTNNSNNGVEIGDDYVSLPASSVENMNAAFLI